MSKIVLGVSSSISIYKSCEIIRSFQERGYDVQVLMTKNASKFISPLLFKALTGNKVLVDLFDDNAAENIGHVTLAGEAVLFVIAPATANVIGKMASGISDDYLTTFYTAAACPVLVAPAMNEKMFLKSKTQENIKSLRAAGIRFIEPEKGYLACGDQGYGRLAPVSRIVEEGVLLIRKSRSLKGMTVLVTGGPTREYLDSVRFLTNKSSGKMGFELAGESERRGAKTIFISGPGNLIPHPGIKSVSVETAEEMKEQVEKYAGRSDIIIMAAAVCDFKFAESISGKIKKESMPQEIKLSRTEDILDQIGKNKGTKILVGFAAEAKHVEENARKKLVKKNLDIIVANNISKKGIGFGSDRNDVILIHRNGKSIRTGEKSKLEISKIIMDEVEALIERESQ